MPNRFVSNWSQRKIWLKRCILPLIIFLLFNIIDDKLLMQFVIFYKLRCPNNSFWNTIYYKLRFNSTQFVIYYKFRNYYKVQRNKGYHEVHVSLPWQKRSKPAYRDYNIQYYWRHIFHIFHLFHFTMEPDRYSLIIKFWKIYSSDVFNVFTNNRRRWPVMLYVMSLDAA